MSSYKFDEDYYIHGLAKDISNYTNYRWLPELTVPMAKMLQQFLNIQTGDVVLDFGCARGYLVKALWSVGVRAYGCDISEWAIKNCDPEIVEFVSTDLQTQTSYDFLFCKDVLEHIPYNDLIGILPKLFKITTNAALFVVPLSKADGALYVSPDDNRDKTHLHRFTLETWITLIKKYATDYVVMGCLDIPVLKLSINKYPGSAGFIYCKKLVR